MRAIKRHLCSALLLLVAAPAALANNFVPPTYCLEGPGIADLTTEGPKYVPVNIQRRFKGDLSFKFPPEDRYVQFWNSVDGFQGTEKSNYEANTYKNMTFPSYARGAQWVWTEEEDFGINPNCSKLRVYVQNMPSISKRSVTEGHSIDIQVNASIDNAFSKNAVEGNGQPKITYNFISLWYNVTESHTTHLKSISYRPRYRGEYSVRATVSDGTYSKAVNLGQVFFLGGEYCNTCGEIP